MVVVVNSFTIHQAVLKKVESRADVKPMLDRCGVDVAAM